jgi:hypothetical protein
MLHFVAFSGYGCFWRAAPEREGDTLPCTRIDRAGTRKHMRLCGDAPDLRNGVARRLRKIGIT